MALALSVCATDSPGPGTVPDTRAGAQKNTRRIKPPNKPKMDVTDGEREAQRGCVAPSRSHRNHGVELGLHPVLACSKAPNRHWRRGWYTGSRAPHPTTGTSQPSLLPAGIPKALALLPGIKDVFFLSFIHFSGARERSGASHSLWCPSPVHILHLPPLTAPKALYGLQLPPHPSLGRWEPRAQPLSCSPSSPGPGFCSPNMRALSSLPCGVVRIPDTLPGVEWAGLY